MTTTFGFKGRLQVDQADRALLERQIDAIMDELCNLGVTDPWIGADLSVGVVDVSLLVEAESFEEAFARAMTTLRSAVHAAGVGTRDWPRVQKIQVEESTVPASA